MNMTFREKVEMLFEDLIFINKLEEGEIDELEASVRSIVLGYIQEDRENISENAKVNKEYYDLYDNRREFDESIGTENIGERKDRDGDIFAIDVFTIDRNSILNAPLPNLE